MRLLLPVALVAVATAVAADFRAAAAKVEITPAGPEWLLGYAARRSTGVHDPIYHRVVVLDDGTTRFYLVSSDVCLFSPTVYDDTARELGLDPARFWWATTHTHSAPEVGPPGVSALLLKGRFDHEWSREYLALVKDRLRQAIREAEAHLEPARLGVTTGMAMANINRRGRDPEGKVSLGLNPAGPVDRQVGLIRLERRDGSPIALIANYAMHGTVMSGKWLEISGDAPGTVAAYVEKKLGAPMLYINGAAGNIAPIYSVYDSPRAGHLTEFNVLLGDPILETNRHLAAPVTDVHLEASAQIVETPRKAGLEWTAALERYAGTSPAGPTVRLPVRYLRLNDVVIWAAPVELFCEIAMRIRERSPFRHTFYFGYANGGLGYLPTAAAFAEGGYEPNTSVFTAAVEDDLTRAVTTHLASMPR